MKTFYYKLKLEHKLLLILILFLFIRLAGLGSDVANTDAARWHRRSERFVSALLSLDPASTYQHYQPGVTLMWLSTPAKALIHKGLLEHADYFPTIHAVGKTSIVWVLGGLLASQLLILNKLYGERVALYFGLLMSLEPYLIGIDRWYHLTSLEVYLAFTSFLVLLLWRETKNKRFLTVCAVLLALSILAKLTSLILLPLFLYLVASNKKKDLGFFLAVLVLSTFVFFPALWVTPVETLQKLWGAIFGAVSNELRGEVIQTIPSYLYYSVVLVFKLSPLTLILFVIALLRGTKEKYALFFIASYYVFLSLVGQKIDRYSLIFIPPILLVIAVHLSDLSKWFTKLILASVVIFFVLVGYTIHPVYSAYYSRLVGGPRRALSLQVYDNSGEYFAQAASYLNSFEKSKAYVPNNIEAFSFYYQGETLREYDSTVQYVVRSVDWDRPGLTDDNCPKLEKTFGLEDFDAVGVFKCY